MTTQDFHTPLEMGCEIDKDKGCVIFTTLCRQGTVVPFTPVHGPENWYAKDYANPESYTYVLSKADISELDAAIDKTRSSGRKLEVGSTPLSRLLSRTLVPTSPAPCKHSPAWSSKQSLGMTTYHRWVAEVNVIGNLQLANSRNVQSLGPNLACVQDLTKHDFPLPNLGPKLKQLLREAQFGRGFQLIRYIIAVVTITTPEFRCTISAQQGIYYTMLQMIMTGRRIMLICQGL